MHKVKKISKKRLSVLRFLAYGITLTLSVITTVLLLYFAQGYRFDRGSGKVVQNGLLLADSKPIAANVYIDGKLRDSSAPSRFILQSGSYELSMESEGYNGWKKQLDILPSKVEEIYYPRLIPKKISAYDQLELSEYDLIRQTPDRKKVLLYSSKEAKLQVLQLDPKTPKLEKIELPLTFPQQSGSYGALKVIEWGLDNKHILLSQILPDGNENILSLNIDKPDNFTNITSLFGEKTPASVHYVGGNYNQIYGLKEGFVSLYNLESGEIQKLLDNIRNYEPYGDNTILFAKNNLAQTEVEYGIYSNKQINIITNLPSHSGTDLLAYGDYDGNKYFAISNNQASAVTIYRNPLSKPILKKQLPFSVLKITEPQKLDFSGGSKHLLAQSGNLVSVYDFEHKKQHQFSSPSDIAQETAIRWVDDDHILMHLANGDTYYVEYDGANGNKLLSVAPGHNLLIANNFETVYRISSSENKWQLQAASLIVKK